MKNGDRAPYLTPAWNDCHLPPDHVGPHQHEAAWPPPAPPAPLPACTNCGHLLGMHTSSTVGHCLAWRCSCTKFAEAGRSSDTDAPPIATEFKDGKLSIIE